MSVLFISLFPGMIEYLLKVQLILTTVAGSKPFWGPISINKGKVFWKKIKKILYVIKSKRIKYLSINLVKIFLYSRLVQWNDKTVLKEIKEDLHKQKSWHCHELIIGKMEILSKLVSTISLSKSQVAFFQKLTNWS